MDMIINENLTRRRALSAAADVSVSTYSELSAAITNAPLNTPYVIEVSANMPNYASVLTISAEKDIYIRGDEGGQRKLTKSTSGAHFTVYGTLTLSNLILDGGRTEPSTGRYGGISVGSSSAAGAALYLYEGAVIERCNAGASTDGGGVSVTNASSLVIDGGVIRNCIKTGGNGGGGIYADSSIVIMNSGEIAYNLASSATSGYGGGISAAFSSEVTINGGLIYENTAALNGGGINVRSTAFFRMTGGEVFDNRSLSENPSGAPLATYGAGIYNASSNFIITGGEVRNNTLPFGNGGGIYIALPSSAQNRLEISNCVISGNAVQNGLGGGIYFSASANAEFDMTNIGLYANTASSNGGGLYIASSSEVHPAVTAQNCTIRNNVSGISGGGVYCAAYGSFTAQNCVIIGNESQTTGTLTGGGGGIYCGDGGIVSLSSCMITDNTAASCGGALYGGSASTISINGETIISANKAGNDGGAIYAYTHSNCNITGALIGGTEQSLGNTASNGGGIFLYGESAALSKAVLDGTIVSYNRASENGGGICTGGTLSGPQHNLLIQLRNGTEISNNIAELNGGGIYGVSWTNLDVSGSYIRENAAVNGSGGGAYMAGGFAAVSAAVNLAAESIVSDNAANIDGGGIYGLNTAITGSENSIIGGNRALNDGGGICASSVYNDPFYTDSTLVQGGVLLNLSNCAVIGNTAGRGGGGICGASEMTTGGGYAGISTDCNVFLVESRIAGNRAESSGGGVLCYANNPEGGEWCSCNLRTQGTEISDNYAENGGGVYLSAYSGADRNAYCVFTSGEESLISGNEAAENGGGIFASSTANPSSKTGRIEVFLGNTAIRGNAAERSGGAVYGISNSDLNTVINIGECELYGNAARYGGAVYGASHTTITMINDTVRFNGEQLQLDSTTYGPSLYGGGIYVTRLAELHLEGTNSLISNRAPDGGGGGVYTEDTEDYSNLTTSANTIFEENYASEPVLPPDGADVLFPNIKYGATSIFNNPLNNYDVNYTREPVSEFVNITYDANGGLGSYVGPDTERGGIDAVLTPEAVGFARIGYIFSGWNTQPGGTGLTYFPGDNITLDDNLTLYAMWIAMEYTMTYNANGGEGKLELYVQNDSVHMVLTSEEAGISREGYNFTAWNTQSEGTGDAYMPGDMIDITGDIILYAQWEEKPAPPPPPPPPVEPPCNPNICDEPNQANQTAVRVRRKRPM